MKTLIVLALAVMGLTVTANAGNEKKATKTVTYEVSLHCESCKNKVEKNIPYEKGVKDLKVDLEKKTVTVTFREDKNTTEGIRKALEKLGYTATVKE